MTFLLYGAGAVLAAAGTRAAAVAFGSAAVFAALRPGDGSPVVAWTAALAGGLIAVGTSPRRIAVPAIGAAAAIAAGSAENAAVIIGLWTLGTAAALAGRPPGQPGRRWAFALLQSDLVFVIAVGYAAATYGFAAWPGRLGTIGVALLLVSALARVPLIGWPEGTPENGLLLVRAQTVVLVVTALRAADGEMLTIGLVGGAVLFAAGAFAPAPAVRDAAQETGLVAVAVAVGELGWLPGGWVWGALAGGTLIHQLRLIGGGRDAVATVARAMEQSAGVGLPLLPAVGAAVAAVLGRPADARFAVIAALGVGLAGRASVRAPVRAHPEVEAFPGWREAMVLVSAAAAVAAPLVSLPRPPGGDLLSWPPVWAAAAVIAIGAAGAALPGLAPAAEPTGSPTGVRVPGATTAMRALDPPGGDRALIGLLSVLGVASVAALVVGWLRGFL